MSPQLIEPYKFQQEINRYAKDIVLLWNPNIERYQVFQALRPINGFEVVGDAPRADRLRPLFTIQEVNGDYRDPDQSDLDRIIESVDRTLNLQAKGFEFVADHLERDDIRREEEVSAGLKDHVEWGANEIYKARVRKGIGGMS